MGPTAHGPIYRRAKKMIAFASPMVDNTAPNTRYFHHLNVDHNSWSSTLFVSAKFSRATKVIVQPRKDDAVRPCVGNTAQLVAHATTTNHIAAYVILEHKKRKRKRKTLVAMDDFASKLYKCQTSPYFVTFCHRTNVTIVHDVAQLNRCINPQPFKCCRWSRFGFLKYALCILHPPNLHL